MATPERAGIGSVGSSRRGVFGIFLAAAIVAGGACASAPPPATEPAVPPTGSAEIEAAHAAHRIAGVDRRQFQPELYWEIATALLSPASDRFRISEIGTSIEGRPLRRIDFGDGLTTVLLWSQMHGDESTASRALLDVFDYLLRNPEDPRVRRIEEELAVTFVPVLNPDGAARFVRHNAVGIDINRDAKVLATPEGRALKAVRDDLQAVWGFNLHDQNIRTRLGRTDFGVEISLLAPPPGDGVTSPPNQNAKHLAAFIVHTLRPVVGDAIARYSETFNPRAFGDLMTQWGTATVLIESGGRREDPDKELARRANFVAILAALDAIATGTWEQVPQEAYAELPPNGRAVADLVIAGGSIVLPGREPVRADVSVRFDDSLARTGGTVGEVGDLEGVEALDVLDVSGMYLIPAPAALSAEGGPHLRPGDTLDAIISRDREGLRVVWRLVAGRPEAPEGR
jgi:hypothetical protein